MLITPIGKLIAKIDFIVFGRPVGEVVGLDGFKVICKNIDVNPNKFVVVFLAVIVFTEQASLVESWIEIDF